MKKVISGFLATIMVLLVAIPVMPSKVAEAKAEQIKGNKVTLEYDLSTSRMSFLFDTQNPVADDEIIGIDEDITYSIASKNVVFNCKDGWYDEKTLEKAYLFEGGKKYVYKAEITIKSYTTPNAPTFSDPDVFHVVSSFKGWSSKSTSVMDTKITFTARYSIPFKLGQKISDKNGVNTFDAIITKAGDENTATCEIVNAPGRTYVDPFNIPTSIRGVTVTSIGKDAFMDCTEIKTAIIPYGIISVGENAFMRTGLTGIAISDSVKTIGTHAFGYTYSLSNPSIKVEGFKVYGAEETEAQKYATENGFNFVKSILSIDVTGVKFPVEGNKPLVTGITVNPKMGSVEGKQFYYISGSTAFPITNSTYTFIAGTSYTVEVYVNAPTGYVYPEGIRATINGREATAYKESDTTYRLWYNFGVLRPKSEMTVSKVTIAGVDEPISGKKGNTDNINIVSGKASIYDASWAYKKNEYTQIVVKDDEVFEAGKEYSIQVRLVPADGYVFSDTLSVTFDGKTATRVYVDGGHTDIGMMDAEYSFGILKTMVPNVTITGVSHPYFGETPVTDEISLPASQGHIYDMGWYYKNGSSWMATDKFELGKEYAIIVRILPPNDYTYTKETSYKVNGQTATSAMPDGGHLDEGMYTVVYSFGELTKRPVNAVAITGVTAPTVGELPKLAGITMAEEMGNIVNVKWFIKQGEEWVATEEAFKDGETYSVAIYIDPPNMKAFANPLAATVDGKEAEVFADSANEGRVIVRCAFDKLGGNKPDTPVNPEGTVTNQEETVPNNPAPVVEQKDNKKADQNITIKIVKKSIKAAKVKKAKQVVKNAIKVKKAIGKVTFKKVKNGSSKFLTINKKTGNITVKKGAKKGAQKIIVLVTAVGDENYNTSISQVTVTIKVK